MPPILNFLSFLSNKMEADCTKLPLQLTKIGKMFFKTLSKSPMVLYLRKGPELALSG